MFTCTSVAFAYIGIYMHDLLCIHKVKRMLCECFLQITEHLVACSLQKKNCKYNRFGCGFQVRVYLSLKFSLAPVTVSSDLFIHVASLLENMLRPLAQ